MRGSQTDIFFGWMPDDDDAYDDFYWEDFKENVQSTLEELFPSLERVDEWDSNEVRILARNRVAEFGLSAYGNVACLGVRPVHDDYDERTATLGTHWIDQIQPRLVKEMNKRFDTLRLLGSFSNGEQLFEATK